MHFLILANIIENVTLHFNDSNVYSVNEEITFRITALINKIDYGDSVTIHIDYGDGGNHSYTSPVSHVQSISTTPAIQHSYSHQGNFLVFGSVSYNETRLTNWTNQYVNVWNKIDIDINMTKAYAEVNEEITFYFEPTPHWNVFFIIDFGDNNTFQHTQGSFKDTFSTSIRHAYSAPGSYTVTLDAWNSMFTANSSRNVRIEYPIPSGSLSMSPSEEYIPFPDGEANFILEYSSTQNDPSNVQCTFDYGDLAETEYVHLTNNQTIDKNHLYKITGRKNVVFSCTNGLSEQSVFSTIYVESFEFSEFNFEYKNPVAMSMKLERVTPTMEYNHYYKSVAVPEIVTFTISLRNFKKIPPNIDVSWDFNDSTPIENFLLKSKSLTHTFRNERRTYRMVITLQSGTKGHTFIKEIKLGIIKFWCDKRKFDFPSTAITLYAKSLEQQYENARYTFNTDTSPNACPASTDTTNNANCTFKYHQYGFYLPSVVGKFGTGEQETVFLTDPIIADFSLGSSLQLDIQPKNILLPPGTVFIKVGLLDTTLKPRPRVKCEMKPGDAVERDGIYTKMQNISSNEPLVFIYNYTSLGSHAISIKCTNYISEKIMQEEISTVNSCFDQKGIFDRQYSIAENPLNVYSANDLYISNRMKILCKNENPHFQWNIFHTNNGEKTDQAMNFENPLKDGRGRLLIKRNTFTDDLLYISLNISLNNTWFSEYTYIKFMSSKPFTCIVGGNYVIGSKNMTFNALAESRMVRSNENLTFTWHCARFVYLNLYGSFSFNLFQVFYSDILYRILYFRVMSIQLTGHEIMLNKETLSSCSTREISSGIVQIESPDESTTYDYALTVTVHEGSAEESFTQIASFRGNGITRLAIKY